MPKLLLVILFIFQTNIAFSAKKFFFFGDSLSDSGFQNNNPIVKSIEKTPIWTSPQGHTWVYYFLQNYYQSNAAAKNFSRPNNLVASQIFHPVPKYINPVLSGNNFAAGGSVTKGRGVLNTKNYKSPSLLQQIQYFKNIYVPQQKINYSSNAYFIWSGGNDLMKKLAIEILIDKLLHKLFLSKLASGLHIFNLENMASSFHNTEENIADNLFSAVTSLQNAGAKKIVVILLPDVGKTPLINDLTLSLQKQGRNINSKQLAYQMSLVTQRTNDLIRKKFKNSNIILVDVDQVFNKLIELRTPGRFKENIQEFGKSKEFFIANNKDPACPPPKLALTCIPKNKNAKYYVFEDLGHPTDQTHQIIGDYIYYQVIENNL